LMREWRRLASVAWFTDPSVPHRFHGHADHAVCCRSFACQMLRDPCFYRGKNSFSLSLAVPKPVHEPDFCKYILVINLNPTGPYFHSGKRSLSSPLPWPKRAGQLHFENYVTPPKKIAFHPILAFIIEENPLFCLVMEKESRHNAISFDLSSLAQPSVTDGSEFVYISNPTASVRLFLTTNSRSWWYWSMWTLPWNRFESSHSRISLER
jgi:hypothetical protein